MSIFDTTCIVLKHHLCDSPKEIRLTFRKTLENVNHHLLITYDIQMTFRLALILILNSYTNSDSCSPELVFCVMDTLELPS